MRMISSATLPALLIGLSIQPAAAQDADARSRPSKAEAAHARRMVRALDDYDVQIERRMRQLRAEQRRYERKAR